MTALLLSLLLDLADISALVWEESRGRADAVSERGAVGLCQVVPRYSRWSKRELLNPWINLAACVEARAYWRKHCGPRWRAGFRQGWKGCER